jgi:hypothetical protein
MALIDVNWNPSRKELRVFAGLQLLFFMFVAWSVYHRTESAPWAVTILAVSALAALVGLIEPRALRPVFVVWMAAVLPIGWVVSHVMIAALFYLIITPIGLTMRLLGRDPMDRKFDPHAKTYWKTRRQESGPKQYFRQF